VVQNSTSINNSKYHSSW